MYAEFLDCGDNAPLRLRIASDEYLLDIDLQDGDIATVLELLSTTSSTYVYAGVACRSRVIWSTESDDGNLTVMVGEDMELWDVAIVIRSADIGTLRNVLTTART